MSVVNDQKNDYNDLGTVKESFTLENQTINNTQSAAVKYKFTAAESFFGVLSISGDYSSATMYDEYSVSMYPYYGMRGDFYIEVTGDESSDFAINFEVPVDLGNVGDSVTVAAGHSGYVSESDVYQFTLTEKANLSADVTFDGLHNENVVYRIYNSNGAWFLPGEDMAAGTYYLAVSADNGFYLGNYELNINFLTPDYAEDNETPATAYDLGVFDGRLSVENVNILNASDVDYYKFTLDSTEIINIDTEFAYTLQDSNGEVIQLEENTPNILSAGDYYVQFETALGEPSFDYSFVVEGVTDLGVLSENVKLENQRLDKNCTRYYKFELTSPERIWCYSTDEGSCNIIDSQNNYVDGFLQAGTYFVEVDLYSWNVVFDLNIRTAQDLGTISETATVENLTAGDYKVVLAADDMWDINIKSDGYCDCLDYVVYDTNGEYIEIGSDVLSAGTYFIETASCEPVTYSLEFEAPVDLGVISGSKVFEDQLLDDGYEVFKFTWQEDAVCNIQVGYNESMSFTLHNADGEEIWLNEDEILVAGDYYIVTGVESGRMSIPIVFNPEIPADAYEENDTIESAADLQEITEDVTLEDLTIHRNGDEDYFKFTLSEEKNLVISTSGKETFDTVLTVYDSEGNAVAENDDYNNSFSLVSETFAAGTYYIKVNEYSNENNGNYNLRIGSSMPEDDQESLFGEVTDLGTLTGSLEMKNVKVTSSSGNWYKFTITETGAWQVRDRENSEYGFAIYDSNGEEVYGDSSILQAGDYYFCVGEESSPGTLYDINVTCLYEDLGTVSESIVVESTAEAYESKYYKFTIDESGMWDVNLKSDCSDLWFEYNLHNADGEYIEIGSDVLSAGTYFIKVFDSEYKTDYVLELEAPVDLGVISGSKVFEDQLLDDGYEVFKFTWQEDAVCNIQVGYNVGYNESLPFTLHNADGEEIWLNEDEILVAGDYYIVTGVEGRMSIPIVFNPEIPADAYEENDTIESAADLQEITEDVTLENLTFHRNGDEDYFKFTLSEEKDLVISTSGQDYLDTMLTICDSEGRVIAENDDYNNADLVYDNGLFSLVSETFAAGTYYIKVNEISNENIGNYNLHIRLYQADAYEENDTMESAADLQEITEDVTLENLTFHRNGDEDYFKFTLSEEKDLVISTSGREVLDTVLTVYDSEGNAVAENDDYNNSFSLVSEIFAAGTYYIKVNEISNENIGNYNLRIGSSMPEDHQESLFGEVTDLGTLTGSLEMKDVKVTSSSGNWYKFTITETGAWQVRDRENSEYGFAIYDPSGEEVYGDSSILQAGDYYFCVGHESSPGTLYDINVTCLYEDLGTVSESIVVESTAEAYESKYYKFTLAEDTWLDINFTCNGEEGYSEKYLYDAAGEYVYYDESTFLTAGDYFVSIYTDAKTDYTFEFETPVYLGVVAGNKNFGEHILNDGTGMFKFTLSEKSFCSILVDGEYFTGDIYDAAGEYITDSTILEAGSYYISVEDINYCKSVYNIQINTAEDLGVLSDKLIIEDQSVTENYYKFTMAEAGIITLKNDRGVDLIVCDAEFEDVESNENAEYQLAAGDYYIVAQKYTDNTIVTGVDIVLSVKDIVAPDKPEITQSITGATNRDVVVYAGFSSDTALGEYSFDGDKWMLYKDGVTVSGNCTLYFRARDAYDNISDVVKHTVSNIDKVAPTLEISADITALTNKDVVLTAAVSDGRVEYFNGTSWVAGNKYTVTENGIYEFRVTDAAGNATRRSFEVSNIDKVAPTLEISASTTAPTNKDVILTAAVSDGRVEYFNGSSWVAGNKYTVTENGTYEFRVTDAAGNENRRSFEVSNIDKVAPTLEISAGTTAPSNKDVILTAAVSDGGVEYFNGTSWVAGNKYTVTENGTYEFRVTDAAGNETRRSFEVSNIDKVAPGVPAGFTESVDKRNAVLDWNNASDSGIAGVSGYEVRYGLSADLSGNGEFVADSKLSLQQLQFTTYFYQVRTVDNAGNRSAWSPVRKFDVIPDSPQNLQSSADGLSWDAIPGVSGYAVEYSQDNFASFIRVETHTNKIDTFSLPAGTYQWRVRAIDGELASNGNAVTSEYSAGASFVVSNEDGNMDMFFANVSGVWEEGYSAEHWGNKQWSGTNEQLTLAGKNKLANVWRGSSDANVLLMSDSSNGDALFMDDIYSALGSQARVAGIDEIRAGAGDDIIDMTSQRFDYSGDGIWIYGGDGNDTVWANKGSNIIFGDAGNDRVIGGSGDDVIAGGSGSDSMHGGGGNDIFVFGGNWGKDTVEQLENGNITLWFEEGSLDCWNAETLTYTDGNNRVQVIGVDSEKISLKFGSDDSAEYEELVSHNAFADAVSGKVFEDKNKGMLA